MHFYGAEVLWWAHMVWNKVVFHQYTVLDNHFTMKKTIDQALTPPALSFPPLSSSFIAIIMAVMQGHHCSHQSGLGSQPHGHREPTHVCDDPEDHCGVFPCSLVTTSKCAEPTCCT